MRLANGLLHPEGARQLVDHAGLAARDHQPAHVRQFGGAANEVDIGTEVGEHPCVLTHVALQREHADAGRFDTLGDRSVRRYQPRSARRCGAARSVTLMPTIASPRPRDTSAMTLASS